MTFQSATLLDFSLSIQLEFNFNLSRAIWFLFALAHRWLDVDLSFF